MEKLPVSPIFKPSANLAPIQPNIVVTSADSTMFYVHSAILNHVSGNGFKSTITPERTPSLIAIPEHSATVTVMLCIIYRISISRLDPSFETLSSAMRALETYGVPLQARVVPNTELFRLYVEQARAHPMDAYILAADYNLGLLAIALARCYLLGVRFAELSDELCDRIGPVYLLRLGAVQEQRVEQLRDLVFQCPEPHEATPQCYLEGQTRLQRAWGHILADLAYQIRPDMSVHLIRSIIAPHRAQLSCSLCQRCVDIRLAGIAEAM